jgi:peptidoglycan/LPS O-acetylase OafA/YrhL
VDIFFVISGFVITGMLLREHQASGRVRLHSFYWRRFKRLAPALALMITVCLLLAIPLLSPFGGQQLAAETGIAATFSLANILIARSLGDYFGAPAEGNLLLNTWSLSVEEQFYLVLPAVLVACWFLARNRRSRRALALVALGILSVLSLFLAVLGSTGYSLDRYFWLLGFFSPLTRVWEFGAGAMLALLPLQTLWGRYPRVALPVSIAGAVLIAAALVVVSAATPWPGPWTLIPVIGTLMLLASGSSLMGGPIRRLLSTRPAVAVGDYSYSLYLWHWPIIVLAVTTMGSSLPVTISAAVLSVAPAVAAYRLVENPLRRIRITTRSGKLLLVGLSLTTPIAISLLVLRGADAAWGLPLPDRPIYGSGSFGLGTCMKLARDEAASPLLDDSCVLGDPHGQRAIYLVGDSQAAQWAEALDESARDLGAQVRVGTAPGCPFLDVYKGSAAGMGADDVACRDNYENTMTVLERLPPGDVVIAQSPGYWLDDGLEVSLTDGDFQAGSARGGVLTKGLSSSITRLEAFGHRPVVVMPLLQLADVTNGPMPSSCTTLHLWKGDCFKDVPLTAVSDQRANLDGIAITLGERGVPLIDLIEKQCPAGSCGLWTGEVAIYADNSHVSSGFSRLTAPYFTNSIVGTGRRGTD